MDVFNIAKSIEKLIFEFLMWLIFYPYTLFRVVFQPETMLEYARTETGRDENVSFESGMKPAIFLFLSIVIASLVAPLQHNQLVAAEATATGHYITSSWINLLVFRMALYSIFPITFALIYDLITPGQVTRRSLQVPFNQQCYICAPFTLVTSISLGLFPHLDNPLFLGLLIAAQIWLVASNFFFFKGQVGKSNRASALLSIAAFAVAWAIYIGAGLTAVLYKGY